MSRELLGGEPLDDDLAEVLILSSVARREIDVRREQGRTTSFAVVQTRLLRGVAVVDRQPGPMWSMTIGEPDVVDLFDAFLIQDLQGMQDGLHAVVVVAEPSGPAAPHQLLAGRRGDPDGSLWSLGPAELRYIGAGLLRVFAAVPERFLVPPNG